MVILTVEMLTLVIPSTAQSLQIQAISPVQIGECDGLWTGPTGGDGFATRIARDEPNGTGGPILDRTGLMNPDPSIDRGDELFRGRGSKIAVLDFSFWRGHEDLERIELEPKGNSPS